ncbi:MAG TPA: DUF1573 domain-containing protein [Lacibacter sp.]|nr:DUF1573 domain-containing protein [Lacibacter sp.]HMO89143.1 DUF1573 domain-containing protein [Lacibacter sp.]HMP87516.1 DUF1573 domain-containing protein [Lacibacter sp.]
MKKILFFTALLLAAGTPVLAQKKKNKQQEATPAPVVVAEPLTISELVHDFGKIPQGKPVYHTFVFQNTGMDSLKIENVQTSCGCTTPEYSRTAVGRGAAVDIKVGYNSAAEGFFEKSVTVYYNGGETRQLLIRGTVWKTPDQSVPGNAALQVFQKQ